MELLLTAPVRDLELVVGKWLGALLFVLTLLAATLVYPIALHLITSPGIDQGLMVSGYLGVILVVMTFLSIGVAVSSLFNNQVAAYITTFGVIALFWWILGMFSQAVGATGASSTLLSYLDMSTHFYDTLYQGVIQLSAVVYYLTLTAVFLIIGAVSIETRRWR